MKELSYVFDGKNVRLPFGKIADRLAALAPPEEAVVITDENLQRLHGKAWKAYRTIVLPPGEKGKTQRTVDGIIAKLLDMGAGRQTQLVGIGGGVVTDLTGYAASVYMRGIRCVFVPTTLLAMCDAALGGKNGVNAGKYKNMVGTIHQPAWILYDTGLLRTLPPEEWRSGFAEVIKHAAIRDRTGFAALEANTIAGYRRDAKAMETLLRKNIAIKAKIVAADVSEAGDRRLLNFGHTLGHAIEHRYGLTHGEAVSIGMVYAARVSEAQAGFRDTDRLAALLNRYGLPVEFNWQHPPVLEAMRRDKKGAGDAVNFVLLSRIGAAHTASIPYDQLPTSL